MFTRSGSKEEKKIMGLRLRSYLQAQDRTVAQASRSTGIPRPTLNNMLYGLSPIRIDDAAKFARFFNVSLDMLITEDAPLPPKNEFVIQTVQPSLDQPEPTKEETSEEDPLTLLRKIEEASREQDENQFRAETRRKLANIEKKLNRILDDLGTFIFPLIKESQERCSPLSNIEIPLFETPKVKPKQKRGRGRPRKTTVVTWPRNSPEQPLQISE